MPLQYEYCFKFDDGSEKSFSVELQDETWLLQISGKAHEAPDWTKLEHCKCPHCPFEAEKVPHCPVAKNLANAAESFKDDKSFRKATVFVKGRDRFYGRQTDLQTGLQSLFGLIMATSDCRHMDFFRPLARHHLPFATIDESRGRMLGHYLITQLELAQKGKETDFEAKRLAELIGNVNILNAKITERIRSVSKGDADWNAITLLDGVASLMSLDLAK